MDKFSDTRKKFEILSKRIRLGIRDFFKNISRVTCPCCGYPTIDERGNYEICNLCNWEDDGQDDEDSFKALGGPNGSYSLDQARENFIKYRIMYSPDNNTTITGRDSKQRESLKNELISIFEKMLTENTTNIPNLWKRAVRVERSLYKELVHSINDHEKSIES